MTDDSVVFVEEDSSDEATTSASDTDFWPVLVVDDDPEVHQSTRFSLEGVNILGQKLQLDSAFSAEEAYRYLATHKEPAVIFLDVVMESHDAGLLLAQRIRHELGMKNARIILRTGQAGYAPELKVISEYDINDYRVKNELTHVRLITSLTAALRSYQQILRLETSHRGLEKIIESTRNLLSSEGFRQFAYGILVQLGSFLNLSKSEGLVVVSVANHQLGNDTFELDDQSIIAATGRYEGLVAQVMSKVSLMPQRELIGAVLKTREHIFDDEGAALICNGQHFSLVVYVDTKRPVDEDEQDLLKVFCQNIGLMSDNLTLIERLNQQAFFDSTTLLPNRLSLVRWIDSHRTQGNARGKLLLINIDYYSNFLATLGQRKCTRLIRGYAERLRVELGDTGEFIAHLGEDTFAAVMPAHMDSDSLPGILAMDVRLRELSVHVISTAVTVSMDNHDLGGVELLSAVHLFMKDAKQKHRRKLSRYTVSELENGHRNIQLLRDLMMAIQHQQLVMYYQPKWEIERERFFGLEALLRWKHPSGNWISPAEFIPLAESAGLTDELFEWVLEAVLKDYSQLLHQLPDVGPVSINLSGQQLHDLTIVERFKQRADQYHVPYGNVIFEVTETAAVSGGIDSAIELLLRLKKTGASISLDDFGTGYSSLCYLARLPVDQLKLDRSFIRKLREPDGIAIVKSIIELSISLGLEVVAEGVEEQPEAELLRKLHANSIQGYLYARPMPVADVTTKLLMAG